MSLQQALLTMKEDFYYNNNKYTNRSSDTNSKLDIEIWWIRQDISTSKRMKNKSYMWSTEPTLFSASLSSLQQMFGFCFRTLLQNGSHSNQALCKETLLSVVHRLNFVYTQIHIVPNNGASCILRPMIIIPVTCIA